MTMEPLIQDVLTAAGVDIPPDSSVLQVWKDWLDVDSVTSMEQIAPLDPAVFTAFSRLLVTTWQSPISLDDSKADTLADQVDAVQVTLWLRHVMDLHVHHQASFAALLLSTGSENSAELLAALVHHIAYLPYLQQQIHYRTQTLRQRTHTSTTPILSRLEQYQETQHLSEVLLQELEQHVERLEHILGEWYAVGNVETRTLCRHLLARTWQEFVKAAMRPSLRMENTSATGIAMTLRVLLRILQGSTEVTPAHRHLLFHQLLPLHQPSSMVLWRDQTSLLDLYHEPLVQCMALLLKRQPEWILPAIEALLQPDIWPTTGGNTPKTVLLLHEMDTFLGLGSEESQVTTSSTSTHRALLARLALCMASDNSRIAERALQFFRNDMFLQQVIWQDYDHAMTVLLRALVKHDLPWNPTVRKMTHYVLLQLRNHDEQEFDAAAERVFGGESVDICCSPSKDTVMEVEPEAVEPEPKATVVPPAPDRFSLRAGMGDWRPPPSTSPSTKHHHSMMLPPKSRPPRAGMSATTNPPLTITGVAPWAGEREPPSTITGVAPWGGTSQSSTTTTHKRNAGEADLGEASPPVPHPPPIPEEEETENLGLKRVLDYMAELKPTESDDQGTSPWAKAQMAESPTLLPTLKFHDLVFGHDLGSGAFGVVKYARQIDKTTTRSHWAEYAVKIISTRRIQEMGYETSVQREIATLRVLSHPCIARLISSFRFGDGAYLVLEYASGGDLHTLLLKHGSLDQESTKFVIGELTSALASIHDLGFVYGDLKPENVLLTETGHIKLTDFGACRPVTQAAKELIRPSGKNLLKELRDGDWKTKSPTKEQEDQDMNTEMVEAESDHRIEGTTAYLPPEVVLGSVPTAAADAWALGCVMYQCLAGRPPLLDQDDHTTKHKIVTFHLDEARDDSDPLFRDAHGADISPEARHLIRNLLSRDHRPSMAQVATDPFFEGMDVFALHRQPAIPLDVGTVAPVEDAQWSRRQYSSIWAPQPKEYDISMPRPMHFDNPLLASKAPIPEGEEANAFFSWTTRQAPETLE